MATTARYQKATTQYTLDRCKEVVDFIQKKFGNEIPKACFNLYTELARSIGQPTDRLITYLNIIGNMLRQADGKMVMTSKKAEVIELLVGA